MTKFVIRRMIQAIPVLFGITIVVYGILLAAPGGPEAKFANNPRMTQEAKDKFIKAWGLDQPIPIQYCRWMGFCNPETEGTMLGSLPTPAAFIGPTGLPNFLPTGMSGELRDAAWTVAKNSVGGRWNWDRNNYGGIAVISVANATASDAQMQLIDAKIDDGDLSTGRFQKNGGRFCYILE